MVPRNSCSPSLFSQPVCVKIYPSVKFPSLMSSKCVFSKKRRHEQSESLATVPTRRFHTIIRIKQSEKIVLCILIFRKILVTYLKNILTHTPCYQTFNLRNPIFRLQGEVRLYSQLTNKNNLSSKKIFLHPTKKDVALWNPTFYHCHQGTQPSGCRQSVRTQFNTTFL